MNRRKREQVRASCGSAAPERWKRKTLPKPLVDPCVRYRVETESTSGTWALEGLYDLPALLATKGMTEYQRQQLRKLKVGRVYADGGGACVAWRVTCEKVP